MRTVDGIGIATVRGAAGADGAGGTVDGVVARVARADAGVAAVVGADAGAAEETEPRPCHTKRQDSRSINWPHTGANFFSRSC